MMTTPDYTKEKINKQIKLRAWHKEWKVINIVDCIDFDKQQCRLLDNLGNQDWCDLDEVIIMQYTGIKDKYEEEIYEGDIIRTENGRVWEVKLGEYFYAIFNQFSVGFYLEGGNCEHPMESHNNFSRIGNINVEADIKEYLS